jgi:hypothetical protein
MKKILIILMLAGVVYAQDRPMPIGLELRNAKDITIKIAKLDTVDITIPLFIVPCDGYIATKPRISSVSGSAAGDTLPGQSWFIYLYARDSIGSAASDTIAKYTTKDSVGGKTMAALKNYPFSWVSPDSSRKVYKREVISLRSDSLHVGTALTNVLIEFLFVPTDPNPQDLMPR